MPETPATDEYTKWKTAIERELRRKERQDWCQQSEKIMQRYRDTREVSESRSGQIIVSRRKYNALWSNVQTLKPLLFSRVPEPQVTRQFKDQDPIARTAAQILERAMATDLEPDCMKDIMTGVVEDRLLPGRGLATVSYKPEIETTRRAVVKNRETGLFSNEDGSDLADDDEVVTEGRGRGTRHFVEDRDIKSESAPLQYFYWQDVLHADCKNWKELQRNGWLAFREEWTKKDATKRFGKDKADKLAQKQMEKAGSEDEKVYPLYETWSIWDAVRREVLWISMDHDEILDKVDDPLGLDGFFNTPPFLQSTTTTNMMIPVPDYHQYRSQAEQLDEMTHRISLLVDGLKVAGVYDGAFGDLANLMKTENKLIKIDNFAMTGDKGLRGVIAFFPLEEIANTLNQLTQAREVVKRDMYEITGIADILRGDTDPRETMGAQRLKGRFATLRSSEPQMDVQEYVERLYQLKAEVMVKHFEPETLLEKASWLQATEMQVDQTPQRDEAPEQTAQRITLQVGENIQRTQAAIALLKEDEMSTFRLEVETDATIAIDEEEERQSKIAFTSMLAQFMDTALTAAKENPAIAPLLLQLLMFTVRGWKVGRELEQQIEDALEKMKNQPPPQPPPDPAMEEVKRRAREDEFQHQEAMAKQQVDMAELALKWRQFLHDAGVDNAQLELQAAEMVGKAFNEFMKTQVVEEATVIPLQGAL